MKNLKAIFGGLVISCVLLLTGCSSPSDPTPENFTNAINNAMAVAAPAILPTPGKITRAEDKVALLEDPDAFENSEKEYSREERQSLKRQITYARLLQSSGLLTMEPTKYRYTDHNGLMHEVIGFRIKFSSKFAKDIVIMPNNKLGLNAGYFGVEKIIKFTEPIPGKNGMLVTKVTYKKTIVSRPEWATDSVIDYSGIKKKLKGNSSIKLQLSSTGWNVEGLKENDAQKAARSIRYSLRSGGVTR